jgi:hypothetical protein
VPRFRRPRLPVVRPRNLNPAEVAAIKSRPWPRLPPWLWTVAALTVAALVVVVVVALTRPGPESLEIPLGGRRSPPAAGLTHDLGPWASGALDPANAGKVVVAKASCPRLSGLLLAGTDADVAVLRAATDATCALRSVGGIDAARAALDEARAVVVFARYAASGNESSTLLAADPALDLHGAKVALLVNGKFAASDPDRIVPLLIHEGAHLEGGATEPDAEAELAARKAERDACRRVFTGGGVQPNRGCTDAAELLAKGDQAALAELRAAGYR